MPPKYYKSKKIQSNNFSNAKYLIIVESPSKCAKIEHFLGIDYCCIASKGHLRQLKGLKSIDTKKTFQPTFSIIDEKKSHIESMKSFISLLLYTHGFIAKGMFEWHKNWYFSSPFA